MPDTEVLEPIPVGPLPDPSPEDLQKYRIAVSTLFESGSREEISNGHPAHAAILIEQMFVHARSSVRIFCRSLNSTVYDSPAVIEGLRNALTRGVEVKVLIQERRPQALTFKDILVTRGGTIMRTTDERVAKALLNFAVMDKRAVRVERDNAHCVASACAHCDVAKDLFEIFDEIQGFGVEVADV